MKSLLPAKRTAVKPVIFLLPFVLFFFLFQLAPVLWVIINSFNLDDTLSLENYLQSLNSPYILQAFSNSLWLAVCSGFSGLVIAALLVNSLRKIDSRTGNAVIAFINMINNFSGVPLAFAFIIILGINGAITLLLRQYGIIDGFDLYGKWGLLAIYIYFQIPLAVLLLYPAFDGLDDDWRGAAALLGASNLQYSLRIMLPVLFPALLGTFVILLANAMGAYASVYALTAGNYNVITVRIASMVSGDIFPEPNQAAAISVLLMLIMLLITVIQQLLLTRSYHEKP